MKVELISITPDAEKVIEEAGRTCYMSKGSDPAIIRKWIESGHLSVVEHASATFRISGISRACYDKETEVLTKNGWKLFKDLSDTDVVATINCKDVIEFQKPIDFIKYKFNGKMHQYKSQSVDLMITPDHNLFIKKYDIRTKSTFNLVSSNDIDVKRFYMKKTFNHISEEQKNVVIHGYSYDRKNNCGGFFNKKLEDISLDKRLFVEFLAWYIGEGSCYYNRKENSHTINITQCEGTIKNNKNREDIFNIIKKMGFSPNINKTTISFKSNVLGSFLKKMGICYEKTIPYNVFDFFDKDLAILFLNTYVKGDGSTDRNHEQLYTSSKILADQMQILAGIAGYSASIRIDDRVGQYHYYQDNLIRHNRVVYVVSLSKGKRNNNVVVKMDYHFSYCNYNDFVYCVEVENHTLLVRRNGVYVWCGNCSHQLVRHRLASFSQQSQRYTKADQFEYVTPDSIKLDKYMSREYDRLMQDIQRMYNYFVGNGVKPEDARFILPNACTTEIVMSANMREWRKVIELRCDKHAQWEVRYMCQQILSILIDKAPNVFFDYESLLPEKVSADGSV